MITFNRILCPVDTSECSRAALRHAVALAVWYEADLDFNCGKRGARRLVWSSDGLIYVTTDHYQSFREVPR